MAVAHAREARPELARLRRASRRDAWGAGRVLPYGAAALVNIAAIVSAWPIYLMPSFPHLALLLVLAGTPVSMYLRAVGASRRLMSIGVAGISMIFIVLMLQRMPLPQAGGDIFRLALLIEGRDAIAFVIQMFITVAMFRSFALLSDRDLTLTIVPALSTLLLSAIAVSGVLPLAALLVFFVAAYYLLAFDHQETWAAQAAARRVLPRDYRRAQLAGVAAWWWLVLVPVAVAGALLCARVDLPRYLMMRYGRRADRWLITRVYQSVVPSRIEPTTRIDLGEGPFLRSTIILRVEATESALWRGTTLDTYTATGWQSSRWLQARQRLALQGGQPPSRDVGGGSRTAPTSPREGWWIAPAHDPGLLAGVRSSDLQQTFRLEVPMQGVIISAYEARAVSGALRSPRVNDSSVVFDSAPMRAGVMYRVLSRRKVAPGAATYRSGVTLSRADLRRYLTPPAIPQDTQRLARRIVAGERDDLHRALALNSYLQEKFVYRERVPRPPRNVDYVDYFLHHMDGAYCDYFASALAVMARINGIPARVVTGFRSTEEDERTGWWIVREKDAHSWVEVFLDGYGWFELDPSPQPGAEPSLVERAQKAWAAALGALNRAARAPFRALMAIRGWRWKSPAVLAALAALTMSIRYLLRDKPPPVPRSSDAQQLRAYARRCYDRMCKWLRAWGLPKAPGSTASEYAASLELALGARAAPMREVIGVYLATEYGGRPVEPKTARMIVQRLESVLAMRRMKHGRGARAP